MRYYPCYPILWGWWFILIVQRSVFDSIIDLFPAAFWVTDKELAQRFCFHGTCVHSIKLFSVYMHICSLSIQFYWSTATKSYRKINIWFRMWCLCVHCAYMQGTHALKLLWNQTLLQTGVSSYAGPIFLLSSSLIVKNINKMRNHGNLASRTKHNRLASPTHIYAYQQTLSFEMTFVQPGDKYDKDKEELTITMKVMTMPTRVKHNSWLIRYHV